MSFAVKCLKTMNKLFPLPSHPFTMQANGEKTYAEWQYEKGEDTIRLYLEYTDVEEMFGGKEVLDVGCGAGGKSLYYLSCGAKRVVGIDILEKYKEESQKLADKLGLSGFEFMVQDASETDFPDNSFDTIIMNDAMEHVSKPLEVLIEMKRILKPGGRLFVNFPPLNHPWGMHLQDTIGIPWLQIFFSDKTMIQAYKELVLEKPNGQEMVDFRISEDENGEDYFSYINYMTIKKFDTIYPNADFPLVYRREVPLRGYFRPLCRGPLKEYFVKMVVCVFEK